MPKPPELPKKQVKVETPTPQRKMIDQPAKLYEWACPVCQRVHRGFSRNICRNERCEMFGREASH